jgi:hypothetical protein
LNNFTACCGVFLPEFYQIIGEFADYLHRHLPFRMSES